MRTSKQNVHTCKAICFSKSRSCMSRRLCRDCTRKLERLHRTNSWPQELKSSEVLFVRSLNLPAIFLRLPEVESSFSGFWKQQISAGGNTCSCEVITWKLAVAEVGESPLILIFPMRNLESLADPTDSSNWSEWRASELYSVHFLISEVLEVIVHQQQERWHSTRWVPIDIQLQV